MGTRTIDHSPVTPNQTISDVESARPLVSLDRSNRPCQGAMLQQGYGAQSHDCTPQQLVRLVGYRDPDGTTRRWDRVRSTQSQREHAK